MKKLKSLLVGLAVGFASVSQASYLVVTRVSYTYYPSTGGTNAPSVSLSNYIQEFVNSIQGSLGGTGIHTTLGAGYQTETYQLYYHPTSPTDTPPADIYLHLYLNGTCAALVTGNNKLSGGSAYVIPVTSGYGSTLKGCSALTPSQPYGYTPGVNTEVDTLAATWVPYGSIDGLTVWKMTSTVTVTSDTVKLSGQLWTTDPFSAFLAAAGSAEGVNFELIP